MSDLGWTQEEIDQDLELLFDTLLDKVRDGRLTEDQLIDMFDFPVIGDC